MALDSVHRFDFNLDGKPDHLITIRNSKILSEKVDRNFDSIFEMGHLYDQVSGLKTSYSEVEHSTESLSKNGDLFKKIQVKGSQTTHQHIFPLLQASSEKKSCYDHKSRESILGASNKFISELASGVINTENDFSYFSEKFKVHESCIDKWGKSTTKRMISNVFKKGISCLENLAQKKINNESVPEVYLILNRFNLHQQGKLKPTSLICHEVKGDWKRSRAKSSSREYLSEGMRLTPEGLAEIHHPFITVSPEIENGLFGFNMKLNENELTGIIFHELIHNYGFLHGDGIDLSYACETCCFEGNMKAKEVACRVCTGAYTTDDDANYLLDIAMYTSPYGTCSCERKNFFA